MSTLAQRLGFISDLGASMGWGQFGGGINWRQTGRARIKAYRAKRRHKNRIASRSRAKNRRFA